MAQPKHSAARRPIQLRGVRQNNLKGFDLDLPPNELVVITGLSGSGKSSLAFDTLYAEGQRRYIETFSPYARQFFDRMDKPAVDRIDNIPPAIAIEQRNSVRTTRSTVGTMTDLCEHMKVLWMHLAHLACPRCGRRVRSEAPADIWAETISNTGSTGVETLITFDVRLTDKMTLAEQAQGLVKQGFQRCLVDGHVQRVDALASSTALDRALPASVTVIADRVRATPAHRSRFIEACEQAYQFGGDRLAIHTAAGPGRDGGTQAWAPARRFSRRFHCATCDVDYRQPTPSLFSYNHPTGACPGCKGFGRIITIDHRLALPDRRKTLAAGVVRPWQTGMSAECQADMLRMAKKRGIPVNVPFQELSGEHQRWVMEGDAGYGTDARHQWPHLWYGVKGYFRWLESKAYKMHVRVLLSRYRSYQPCPECEGRRLNREALQFKVALPDSVFPQPAQADSGIQGITLATFYSLSARNALAAVDHWMQVTQPKRNDPLGIVLGEVRTRLNFLVEVGLGYLTLDRATRTLSGGETERVNLTTCLGSRLVNALFVLDEPSVGLHPRDTDRLIEILRRLKSSGNTVVVVEHEPSVMLAADRILDLGPGHGETGGQLVYNGSPAGLGRARHSLTADYLTGRRRIPVPVRRAVAPATSVQGGSSKKRLEPLMLADHSAPMHGGNGVAWLHLRHVSAHNLKDLSVSIPLGRLVCVTGVSGSGKSTLVRDVLVPLLDSRAAGDASDPAEAGDSAGELPEGADEMPNAGGATLEGADAVGSVVHVDQSSLGRTPRSNPAVYVGAFEDLRQIFAALPSAVERGLGASAFSFNSAQGQCERCRGAGFEKIEMQFLSDVYIRCPECQGRRYRPHVLDIRLPIPAGAAAGRNGTVTGWSISEILEASAGDVISVLELLPGTAAQRALKRLRLLQDVGLDYLRLGQPINTLSGGECQRLKLATHLAEAAGHSGRPDGDRGAGSKPNLFVFDEPTTGLHFEDVRILLLAFQRLVDAGHSVLVIEHNMEVIKCADWVIDLGPDAGEDGGRVVAAGPPEAIARCKASHTGRFLKAMSLAP